MCVYIYICTLIYLLIDLFICIYIYWIVLLIVQAPIPALLAYLIRVAFPDLDEDWECQAASCFLGENMSSPCSAALPMMLAPLGGRDYAEVTHKSRSFP